MRSHHSNFLFLFFLYNTKRSLCTVYTFSIFFVLATSFDICTYVALDDKACSSQHLLDCCHSASGKWWSRLGRFLVCCTSWMSNLSRQWDWFQVRVWNIKLLVLTVKFGDAPDTDLPDIRPTGKSATRKPGYRISGEVGNRISHLYSLILKEPLS